MKRVICGLGLISALVSMDAFAAPEPHPCCRNSDYLRWYGSLSASLLYLNDTEIKHTAAGYAPGDGQSYKPGFGVSAAVGYKIFSGIRSELEITERSSDINKDITNTTALTPGTHSQESSTAIMYNMYVDLHNKTHFTPYFGAGIGEVHVKNPRYYTDNGTGQVSEPLTAWTLGYQFMAGVNYEIDDAFTPMEIFLGYKYMTGQDAKVKLGTAFPGTTSFSNDSHNLELGARLYFK